MKTITATKIGAGQFKINCFVNNNLLGTFETNDAQLFDDVQEMRNDGFESELMTCETFEELVINCIKTININKMRENGVGEISTHEHHTLYDGTQVR